MKTVPTLAALIPVEVAPIMVEGRAEAKPIQVAPALTPAPTPARTETVGRCKIANAV
ncbi:MAG: hypothetical protein OXU48_09395 [candidate division Zixibacteria bacterium]|nr:hypothetical protein [candidate division Zixibacteria bacterium]